ncbi:hypothetical protein [Streptococcus uberis]|uniref:hypothetical protein n=1 Tax=Streptococcus uberis TaxID=1349 RepID=UPI003D774279
MNRLKQLREEKHLNTFELVESIRHIAPTMTAKDWIDYENNGLPNKRNDEFWQKVAEYFGVTLAYLKGDSKIPNEDYIIDLQDVLHREYELKLEKAKLEKDLKEALDRNLELEQENGFLRKENQEMTEDLYNIDVVVNDFKERNHIDS